MPRRAPARALADLGRCCFMRFQDLPRSVLAILSGPFRRGAGDGLGGAVMRCCHPSRWSQAYSLQCFINLCSALHKRDKPCANPDKADTP